MHVTGVSGIMTFEHCTESFLIAPQNGDMSFLSHVDACKIAAVFYYVLLAFPPYYYFGRDHHLSCASVSSNMYDNQ